MTLLLFFRPHRYGATTPPAVTAIARRGVHATPLSDNKARRVTLAPSRERKATLS